MKTILFLAFTFFLAPAFSQQMDSLAVAREVDSLLQISRTLTGQRAFDKALDVNAVAEKIAFEKFGRESAAYGSTCFNRGSVNYFKSDYLEAEKWFLESQTIRANAPGIGKEHPDYAHSLFRLAVLNKDMGDYEKAEKLHLEAKDIREKKLGKEHPDYAQSLNSLAILYYYAGNYEKAEPFYLDVLALREKKLGKGHPDYAGVLINLANLYKDMGNYEKAENFYLHAKAVFEDSLNNRTHPFYSNCLNGLANLYTDMSDYEKAEIFYLEAKDIREKTLGKGHPLYASSVSGLAALYSNMGNYEKAEPLFLEALAVQEKTTGKENPQYAYNLSSLALLYFRMGNYEKAEPLFLEAKDIQENTIGKEHPQYAYNLNNLANLYQDMGNHEKAEVLYLEAKGIQEKTLGKENNAYASSLNSLAALYSNMGNYKKAEPLYLEAKDICEKMLGKGHPYYAIILDNLASLYMHMYDDAKAELFYLEAKDIREKTLGKENPVYAAGLGNLAILYYYMGNYEKAEPLYLKAKDIQEKTLGKKHPQYTNNLNNLTNLYEINKRFPESESVLEEIAGLSQKRLVQSTTFLSEREIADYTADFQFRSHNLLAFALARPTEHVGQLPALCYDNSLLFKGFLLNSINHIKHLALSDSTSAEQYYLSKSYQRRLAAEYVKPITERSGVAELEEKANTAEKELARSVAGYGNAIQQVNCQNVLSVLKKGEAAIEFLHFQVNFPKNTDSTLYAALLLRPGAEQPVFIPLFEEKSLDSLLHASGERRADYVNQLYSLADRGARPLGKPQKSLYDLLWKPLEPHLSGVKTIYYAPSGLLHRLNLAAVPINLDSVLGDQYNLVELGSTRQLVIPATVKSAANDAVLFGDISYDADSTAIITSGAISSTRGELSFAYTDSTLRVGSWSELRFTGREVASVEKTMQSAGLQTDIYLGYAATEEAFKTIGNSHGVTSSHPVTGSPRVLHIATHGYFFPDPKSTSARFQTSPTLGAAEPVFKLSDHPMIRSGLILAGGNHAWQTGKPIREGQEDGILTAYEISQMNLSNTELVVLSACETGLGDIQGNEGVYGLQRAFKIAGAKYLIMSLWQVNDQATMQFMEVFYRKWLEDKLPIPEAFRATQAEMRARWLGQPYLWAGFVLVE